MESFLQENFDTYAAGGLRNFKVGSYDLLIIDIVMPEMDGFGLYEEIRKIDNQVRVCFITGFEVNYHALRAVFPSATNGDDIGLYSFFFCLEFKSRLNFENLLTLISYRWI
jgi:CheY-like chemotaxis protein